MTRSALMIQPQARRPLALVHQDDPIRHLTPREREVLGLIAEGHGNAAICAQLWIGAKTLERHVQNIFSKLDLPPDSDRHRRVCAVLAWLRSPLSRPQLEPLPPVAVHDGRFLRAAAR